MTALALDFSQGRTPVGDAPPDFSEGRQPVGDAAPAASSLSSVAKQVPVGFNEALANMAGAPVDALTWGMNKIPGVHIERPFGGSDSIKGAMGAMGINPEDSPARTTAERIARGVGGGAAAMVAPEAALAGVTRAGVTLAPRVAETLGSTFGRAESLPGVAGNAAVGGVAGGSGTAAAAAAPEPYKPLAEMAGNLAGGGVAAAGGVLGREVGTVAARTARDYVAPLTAGGRERVAAETMAGRASNPAGAADTLTHDTQSFVPGSQPTTFQASGDMGLGALERETATRNPVEFNQRRADQNVARTTALEGLQSTGSPADVSNFLRNRLREIEANGDEAMARATREAGAAGERIGGMGTPEGYGQAINDALAPRIEAAAGEARGRVHELGGAGTPEAYGGAMRDAVAEARATAKAHERALWQAVDPDGSLTLRANGLRATAREIEAGMTDSARPISGEERAIFDRIGTYPSIAPFREITDLRSRISAAMREELRSAGETPTYARLARLRGAVEQQINGAVERRAAGDAQAAAQGAATPEQTIAGRLNQPVGAEAPTMDFGPPQQRSDQPYRVSTADGRTIEVRPMAMNARDLITSSDVGYDAGLQPRDRSRAASDQQIREIAARLNPERLGHSSEADRGAPIIGPDRMVESGNGRILALRQAYQQGGEPAQRYRDWLASQGVDVSGLQEPVLVRQRVTDLTPEGRRDFAVSANRPATLSLSTSERAASDARLINADALDLIGNPNDLSAAANRSFVRAFVGRLPQTEQGAMVAADGSLSSEGLLRVRNALVARAYGNEGVLTRIAEATNDDVKSISNALIAAAPHWARLRADVDAGLVRADIDQTPALVEAVSRAADLRASGQRFDAFLAQQDAFDRVSPVVEDFMRMFYDPQGRRSAGANRIADALRFYVEEGRKVSDGGLDLGLQPVSVRDLQRNAQGKINAETNAEQALSSGGGAGYGAGAEAGIPQVPGPGTGQAGREPGVPGGGRNQPGQVGPGFGQLEPNFDAAAQERLNAASTATRERAETFDRGPVGGLLKTTGMRGQYRLPDSAVPDNVFRPGPRGAETIEAYRRGAGDNPATTAALEDYAAASMRRVAERPDGTIDPRRYDIWRRKHQDALRALPGLQERMDAAAGAGGAVDAARIVSPDTGLAQVPEVFFRPGPGGFEDVGRLRAAVNDDGRALGVLQDFAASRLRSFAVRPDGSIDPAKLATWRARHADALRAFPELDARFADAGHAAEAIGDASAARKAAIDDFHEGSVGKLIGVSDPQDVTRVIGGIFGQRNAVQAMGQIAARTAADPAAKDGLRKAVIDHITGKLIGNTEGATSGASLIKSDQFQTFIKNNAAVLRQVFSLDEIASMRAIADDLQRANRSITAVKLPGGSNTAQDSGSLLSRAVAAALSKPAGAGAGAGTGFSIGTAIGGPVVGGITAAIGAMGGAAIAAARQAGMSRIDDLVKAALLDPKLAAILLQKGSTVPGRGPSMRLAQYLNRVTAQSLFDVTEDQKRGTGERKSPIALERPADVTHAAERTADPSPAQAEAGNYAKRHVRWKGLDLSIETEPGQVRAGIGEDGKPWSTTMVHPYGYVKGTTGADADQVDVYVGPHPHSQRVFVVDQIGKDGRFDEHKAVIGARNADEASGIYDSGFSDGSGPKRRGAVHEMSIPAFKTWLASGDTSKPLAYREPVVGRDGTVLPEYSADARPSLDQLFNDPRSAKEIRKDMAAGHAADAVGSSAATRTISPGADFFSSMPRGVLTGAANAASAVGQAAQIEMGQPIDVPSGPEATAIMEHHVTGDLPHPQGRAGKFGASIGEILGNPGNWIGPGGLPYKTAWNIGSGAASEAAGQIYEGTPYEHAARFAGSWTPLAAERAIPLAAKVVPQGSLGSLGGKMIIPERPVSDRVSQAWKTMDDLHAAGPDRAAFNEVYTKLAEFDKGMLEAIAGDYSGAKNPIFKTKQQAIRNILETFVAREREHVGVPDVGDTQKSGFYFSAARKLADVPDEIFKQGGQAVINSLQQAGVKRAELDHLRLGEKFGDQKSVTRQQFEAAIDDRMFDFKRRTKSFNPERSTSDYDYGGTRAFAGPRIPGRGEYFERLMAFPKKLNSGEEFAPGSFESPHWQGKLPGTWASWRGSVREVPGYGKMVVGEEGQSDFMQGAMQRGDDWTGRRPRIKPEEYLALKGERDQYKTAMSDAYYSARRATDGINISRDTRDRFATVLAPNSYGEVREVAPEAWRYRFDEVQNWWERQPDGFQRTDALEGLAKLKSIREANEKYFLPGAHKKFAKTESSFTPESPIDQSYVRTMARDLLMHAAKEKAEFIAISTSDTTARIQNNAGASHFYDAQLKPALERELRRLTGDQSISLTQAKLPKPLGGARERPFTVWAAKLPPNFREAAAKGFPLFGAAGIAGGAALSGDEPTRGAP